MNWNQILAQIMTITSGTHLDPYSRYKHVMAIPPHPCHRNGYNGVPGFKVQIGADSELEIPITLLREICYQAVFKNSRLFDVKLFRQLRLRLFIQTPCFVNSIGGILVCAGVADRIGRSEYSII